MENKFITLINENGRLYNVEQAYRQNYADREATAEEIAAAEEKNNMDSLRNEREDCFAIINRGQLWYNTLAETQLSELTAWYQAWLKVTETKIIPEKPIWLK